MKTEKYRQFSDSDIPEIRNSLIVQVMELTGETDETIIEHALYEANVTVGYSGKTNDVYLIPEVCQNDLLSCIAEQKAAKTERLRPLVEQIIKKLNIGANEVTVVLAYKQFLDGGLIVPWPENTERAGTYFSPSYFRNYELTEDMVIEIMDN